MHFGGHKTSENLISRSQARFLGQDHFDLRRLAGGGRISCLWLLGSPDPTNVKHRGLLFK